MTMKLLANHTSPYVRIARIAMMEKGLDFEFHVVDPWGDDPRLMEPNSASRVPTLVTDDGTPLTESLLVAMWLEATRPAPAHPSLLGTDPTGVASRAGIAMGVIDAAVHTIIIRKVTAPVLFDDTPMGLRRRRTMIEGLSRLDARQAAAPLFDGRFPTIDAIAAVTAYDYIAFRFSDGGWLKPLPNLDRLSRQLRERPAFASTMPHA
jgi:glutathione S-transferase